MHLHDMTGIRQRETDRPEHDMKRANDSEGNIFFFFADITYFWWMRFFPAFLNISDGLLFKQISFPSSFNWRKIVAMVYY